MTEKRFDEVVEEVCEQVKQTLLVKAKEYRRQNNPFHNFDIGSQRSGLIREKVLDGFLLKHEISIADMTNDLEKKIFPSKKMLDEKFGDNIIYLILKKASILDKMEIAIENEELCDDCYGTINTNEKTNCKCGS